LVSSFGSCLRGLARTVEPEEETSFTIDHEIDRETSGRNENPLRPGSAGGGFACSLLVSLNVVDAIRPFPPR